MRDIKQIVDDKGNVLFEMGCDSEMEKYRHETFWTKEPETLEWIRRMDSGNAFIDIGANIGIYSLYAAAMHPEKKIIAVEPMLKNFIRLCENIELNGFIHITPIYAGVSMENEIATFFLKSNDVGDSGSQLDEPVDENGNKYTFCGAIDVVTVSLAMLMGEMKSDVKIDVDGNEYKILMSAKRDIKCINSALIEINRDKAAITAKMKRDGFKRDKYYDDYRPHSSERRNGKPENVVFTRHE